MSDATNGDIIYIERNQRALSDDEINEVNNILEGRGFQALPNIIRDAREGIPARDFSPTLDDLKDHFRQVPRVPATAPRAAAVSDSDTSERAAALVDESADLRMYLVRHTTWTEEDMPRTVIISMRQDDSRLIAFSLGGERIDGVDAAQKDRPG